MCWTLGLCDGDPAPYENDTFQKPERLRQLAAKLKGQADKLSRQADALLAEADALEGAHQPVQSKSRSGSKRDV